ncbi:hypothetical protein HWV62_40541, partial [Athelia sp. TMB]
MPNLAMQYIINSWKMLNSKYSTNLKLAQKHYRARVLELRELIVGEEEKFKRLVAEIEEIRAGLWDNKIAAKISGVSLKEPTEMTVDDPPEAVAEVRITYMPEPLANGLQVAENHSEASVPGEHIAPDSNVEDDAPKPSERSPIAVGSRAEPIQTEAVKRTASDAPTLDENAQEQEAVASQTPPPPNVAEAELEPELSPPADDPSPSEVPAPSVSAESPAKSEGEGSAAEVEEQTEESASVMEVEEADESEGDVVEEEEEREEEEEEEEEEEPQPTSATSTRASKRKGSETDAPESQPDKKRAREASQPIDEDEA